MLNNKTYIIASIVIFGALYSVLRLIPFVPMVGGSGAFFSISDIAAPLYGSILGLLTGGSSIILGTFLAIALGKPAPFLGLDFLPATINAIAIAFMLKRKWKIVILLNSILLITFLLHPFTSVFINISIGDLTIPIPFAWLHIIAFIVLLSPLSRKAVDWFFTLETKNIVKGLAILAFVGTMMQHLMGNLLYETIFGQVLQYYSQLDFATILWPTVFYLYPIERVVLVILTVVVGAPLIRTLRRSLFIEKNPNSK